MGLFHIAKAADQHLPDDSSISKYVFWTLEDDNEAHTSSNVSIGSAAGYVEYEYVVKYDLSQHAVWSDLVARTKKAISVPGRQYVLAINALKVTTTTAC